jgi:hypothetical protein
MIANVLYVSRSLIQMPRDFDQFADMHFVSLTRNAVLDLTGFLVATPTHFAQYLEGEQSALDDIMVSIRADDRHSDIRLACLEPLVERRFPFWRMACFAPTSFAARHVEPMVKWYEMGLSVDTASELVEFMQFSSKNVTGSYLVL